MTNFQVVSDLHIEYKSDKIPDPLSLITPTSDILILAGDIGSLYKYDQLKSFLILLCPYFKVVLYIPGNHEYYKVHGYRPQQMSTLLKKLYQIQEIITNLYVLNTSSVQINDVCIVGCTLWSNPLVNVPKFIVRIHGMYTNLYKKKFEDDLSYIQKMMVYSKKKNLKLLVVTHHCPTYSVITTTKKKNDKYISLYASNLDYLLTNEYINTWVCGHIHINFDHFTKNGTHLIGNQKGKKKDRITDYNKKLIITI
jgi:predicted phosphohydrolase